MTNLKDCPAYFLISVDSQAEFDKIGHTNYVAGKVMGIVNCLPLRARASKNMVFDGKFPSRP